MVFIIAVAIMVGWLVGINFVWWAQIGVFIGMCFWVAKESNGKGLDGIFPLAFGFFATIAGLIANLVYIIAHPEALHKLSTVWEWFKP